MTNLSVLSVGLVTFAQVERTSLPRRNTVASEAEGLGEMGEPAAMGASEAWEAALDDVLYSASPSTNLEADPAKSNTSDIFLYALAGCFPFCTLC